MAYDMAARARATNTGSAPTDNCTLLTCEMLSRVSVAVGVADAVLGGLSLFMRELCCRAALREGKKPASRAREGR